MAKGFKEGFIQIYTGDGKGKTTAALGLALRAAGHGLRTYIAQFMKGREYSETEALKKHEDSITIRHYGSGNFICEKPGPEDKRCAVEGLEEAKQYMVSGEYDVVILDEANIAAYFDVLSVQELLAVIDAKPEHVELVITGRRAHELILEKADLITEMHEIKHYYQKGVSARHGIEF